MPSKSTPLGQLLKARRKELGWSRPRAAELSGVSVGSLESWEGGRILKPALHDVLKLARVLGIPLTDIERAVFEEDEAPKTAQRERRPPTQGDPGPVLLERTIAALRWTEEDAARALSTSSLRIRALRTGHDTLTTLEVVTLTTLLLSEQGNTAQDLAARSERRRERSS